jgi:imidazole glycerol-phosphate synthase subunit HisH
MIVIIDYHMGNIKNVSYALGYLGYKVKISDEPETIKKARGLILPGVGAFRDAAQVLREKKLDIIIQEMVERGKPFLGICLGMQLLFSYSEENGRHQGLGLIPGRVVRFSREFRVPHLGWNQVKYYSNNNKSEVTLFSGIQDNYYFYFLHSYYCIPDQNDVILAQSDYHNLFVSAVLRENIFGVQFHPEKSSSQGLNILKNFGEICNANYSGN